MRDNEATVIVGERCVLVPYLRQHVDRYHEWMKDPALQELTASEPLSIQEEYEMQESWHQDPDKLTFIVLSNHSVSESEVAQVGTVSNEWLDSCPMIGDVNLFLAERDEEEEEETGPDKAKARAFQAECELMIAEKDYRGKGHGKEALKLMIAYAKTLPLGLKSTSFIAKIGLTNEASLRLFEKLGFEKVKISEVWQEAELHLREDGDAAKMRSEDLRTLRWSPSHI